MLRFHDDLPNRKNAGAVDAPTDSETGPLTDTDLAQWEAWRTSTTSRHAAAVSRLLATRPELRGVSPLADTVEESVRWAV